MDWTEWLRRVRSGCAVYSIDSDVKSKLHRLLFPLLPATSWSRYFHQFMYLLIIALASRGEPNGMRLSKECNSINQFLDIWKRD